MPAIVIMGVSGCGKTTLAQALADALHWHFVEGDDLHPVANIAKMAAAQPLTDADRQPFLHNVGKALAQHANAGVVVSCSALKRSYRDVLRTYYSDLHFVLPVVSREALSARLQTRSGHFMPASLLDSQLATLELPKPDESALLITGEAAVDDAIAKIRVWLKV